VRKKFGLSFTLINYLTELFDASALWILKDVDYFLVPTEEAKYRLLKRGISEEKLGVFDFPIRNAFFQIRNGDSREIALKLGLDTDKKTLLMSLGGQGNGNLLTFIDMLIEERVPLNVIACTGKNEDLKVRLEEEYGHTDSSVTLKVFGYTDRMHELMMAADFCFIKPGPNTFIEAMVLQKPMIFTRPVHQGEKANIQFAEQNQIGFSTGDSPGYFLEIVKILLEKRRYRDVKSNFRNIVIRNGAKDIARFIASLMDDSHRM
jgi:processive 1,2-diacylglycerol beta-glucosyltransferase